MSAPSESDSMPPVGEPPRVCKFNDHQHTEQSRIEGLNLAKRPCLEAGERNPEMDSAAMAELDSQDLCSDPLSSFSSDSSATTEIRTATEKEHNMQLVPSVGKLATPHDTVEVVAPNLPPSLLNLLTMNIADQKTKPEISINLKYEVTAPNRTLAAQPLLDNGIAQITKAQPREATECSFARALSRANEGFDVAANKQLIPKEATTPITGVPNVPKKPKTLGNLPPNAAQQDPSVLLNYMRPHTRYEDLGRCYDTMSLFFTARITVDGMVFEGQGWSKKMARKAAAARACRELFGVVSDAIVPN